VKTTYCSECFCKACQAPLSYYWGDGICDDGNNNIGCGWDGGDCCGSNVNQNFCKDCQCLEPNRICKFVDNYYSTSCSYWAGLGYCDHSYVNWMNFKCKKACLCTTACQYSDNYSSCSYWAGLGYCVHSYVPFMQANCKKSCFC